MPEADNDGSEAERDRYQAPALRAGALSHRAPSGVAIVVLSVSAAVTGGLFLWGSRLGIHVPPLVVALVLMGMALVFVSYAIQREMQFRRLASRLNDERVLSVAYSNRVRDLSALVASARTINGVLELDDALSILLDEALGFFQASQGSIMLLDGAGFLQTVCSRGNDRATGARLKLGDSIAGHVALTREPLLIEGKPNPKRFRHLVERDRPVETAMCVPLIHRGELIGVLNVNGDQGRPFKDHDLQLLSVFAGHASIAIANARIFEADRDRLSQLADLNRAKSEVIGSIGEELRVPATVISGGIQALRPVLFDNGDAEQVLRTMEEHALRLAGTVDRLLMEAEVDEKATRAAVGTSDLSELADTVARDFEASGRTILVDAPGPCTVMGDASLLQQVMWNLLDNAFKHGEPPVRLQVRAEDGAGVVSVIDEGPGIAPGDRERIFERFSRLSGSDRKGLGLGLSIVQAVVSACGGRAWAENAPEGGAIFRVALPLLEHLPDPSALREVSA